MHQLFAHASLISTLVEPNRSMLDFVIAQWRMGKGQGNQCQSLNVLRKFRESSEKVLRKSWEISYKVLRKSWESPGKVLKTLCENSRKINCRHKQFERKNWRKKWLFSFFSLPQYVFFFKILCFLSKKGIFLLICFIFFFHFFFGFGLVWPGKVLLDWQVRGNLEISGYKRTNTRPTNSQPPDIRAIQISFVGLGGQGKSGVWWKGNICS